MKLEADRQVPTMRLREDSLACDSCARPLCAALAAFLQTSQGSAACSHEPRLGQGDWSLQPPLAGIASWLSGSRTHLQ